MSKNKNFNVKLNNGKEVNVQPERDGSYSVFGGHSHDSISSIKSDKYLNEKTPELPSFANKK